jgi:ribonuclease BN (tRNA processing enzyme)
VVSLSFERVQNERVPVPVDRSVAMNPASRTEVITLGTAGGPRWWGPRPRAGIATAVVVGDACYLVDCGYQAAGQLHRAGLSPDSLRAVFLTHLHSDHVVDLPGIILFGQMAMRDQHREPVAILGPGNRGMLPPLSPQAVAEPSLPCPRNPTPGTAGMVGLLVEAYGTDQADRIRDSLRPDPLTLFRAADITLPSDCGFHPNDNPHPAGMAPFRVFEDDRVRVTATLVRHPPIAPAFAFRFDSDDGSVVVSGDTAPSENLVRLADGAELLLHEALDFDAIAAAYDGHDRHIARATMEHHRKSHTSPADAGRVAARAGVEVLALHHLAPAHSDPSAWLPAKTAFGRTVVVPDDLQAIPLGRP